ncbi:hypothetical protein N7462_006236 [Penicillium macrosclerotiorum]|uniref:uncharacterized protein n=1 Tax=Penicillium macrosclerotiorum TaxID=303699 RepID=UPI0025469890|nr:uncharacterized protein N7462_006236 [Penicillium macrosclerotiorum]KAJ5683071.1 hypothetical protein N7462_006236 [Penicillium macrosclerotiorum]
MRFLPGRHGKAQPSFMLILILLIAIVARVSAEPAGDATTTDAADAAQTTDDPSTTDNAASATTTSSESSSSSTSESTSSSSSTSSTSTSMDSTTTSSSSSSSSTSSTSSTSDSTTTTSSVSTTTASTSSSSTSTAAAIVTVPPTANAPYMQTSNTPEGTVFIAVGAILGFIGLAVLAWRGMVAWSVNRSVRRAALASSESKRLLRNSRKKRSTVYSAAPAADVSLEKLGAATRASYKPSKRVPSSNSGLFFSPTAGGAGSHHSLNNSTGNRASTYLPPGYYTAAGTSTPNREASGSQANIYSPTAGLSSPPGYPPSSPSVAPTSGYHETSHARHSYVGASTSSLNLSQPPQGRAPSAYLEDLFESHTSPRQSDSGHRPYSGR